VADSYEIIFKHLWKISIAYFSFKNKLILYDLLPIRPLHFKSWSYLELFLPVIFLIY